MLIHHYFYGDDSLYTNMTFEWQFGMSRLIDNRLWEAYEGVENFGHKTDNATTNLGILPFVKFAPALRLIRDYADILDNYLQTL